MILKVEILLFHNTSTVLSLNQDKLLLFIMILSSRDFLSFFLLTGLLLGVLMTRSLHKLHRYILLKRRSLINLLYSGY